MREATAVGQWGQRAVAGEWGVERAGEAGGAAAESAAVPRAPAVSRASATLRPAVLLPRTRRGSGTTEADAAPLRRHPPVPLM